MIDNVIAEFTEALVPICICVVLPVLIVWLVGRVKQNETNRKAEIMLKALDNGAKIDADFFRSQRGGHTIKERLLNRLTRACVTGLMGVALISAAIFLQHLPDWTDNIEGVVFFYLLGGTLIAVGISLFIVYFSGKKMLSKEMEAEEKQLTEGR
ncbi:MAG: hypothetical protein J5871_04965 [Bacteroidales bacterium]|nr:hypothetical protein [Bacteroidales bacterium]